MTHAELVQRAGVWLQRQKCVIVMLEPRNNGNIEIPDAIGWLHDGRSIVVECKATRADFKADSKKAHRVIGMGVRRYFLTPKGLINLDDLCGKWGLISPFGGKFRVLKESGYWEHETLSEMRLLVAEARSDTPNRALLFTPPGGKDGQ